MINYVKPMITGSYSLTLCKVAIGGEQYVDLSRLSRSRRITFESHIWSNIYIVCLGTSRSDFYWNIRFMNVKPKLDVDVRNSERDTRHYLLITQHVVWLNNSQAKLYQLLFYIDMYSCRIKFLYSNNTEKSRYIILKYRNTK